MVNNRLLGFGILSASLIFAAIFISGLITYPFITLRIIALIIVALTFGLLGWVGYTMWTEPKFISPKKDVTTNLTPEDINEPPHLNVPRFSTVVDAKIGAGTIIRDHVNLFKCTIGENCKIESFVYIEEGVTIGNNCKVKPHVYLPSGVIIEDDVFIGPNVTFTNDKYPHVSGEWALRTTTVGRGSSIGAGSVVLPGIRIGRNVMIGAGSVVTKDIPDDSMVYGNPAKATGQ